MGLWGFFPFSIPCILEHRRAAARHLRLFLSHLIAQVTISDRGEKENFFHFQNRQTGAPMATDNSSFLLALVTQRLQKFCQLSPRFISRHWVRTVVWEVEEATASPLLHPH